MSARGSNQGYPNYAMMRPRLPWRRSSMTADEAKQRHRELGVEIRMALGKYAIDFPDALEGYADAPIMDAPIMTMKPWVSGN
ncbi:hypothetical protein [Nitrobacter sp. TKz-YC01]|uniref:hypothetical protein n=1 Tax=Nitrobacter sp. TKz-YC01 TaxID=3398703 RepID=UPI003A1011C3